MKLAIGSDHVGIELKPTIIDYLKELGHEAEYEDGRHAQRIEMIASLENETE